MKVRRLPALSGIITLLATMAGLLFLAAPAQSAQPIRYVALGDSYSAASGVLPSDLKSPLCLRSTRNYAHVIAVRIGASLTDVTCGAAKTSDFTSPQYPGVRPQLDALKPDTQLVTMTIGGNDSGVFVNAILKCGSLGVTALGRGNPCQKKYGGSFENTVRNVTFPALVGALGAVKAKAPAARIAILGYPWITPASGGCFPRMPISSGDVPYMRSLQATLNDAIRRAALATGVTYVNLNSASEGHDACKAGGVRWIEPVLAGTNPVIVHPNALGQQEMAKAAISAIYG